MARKMFCILLLSGSFHFFSALRHRQYQYVEDPKSWPEARQYCREKHTDLAAVNDKQDLGELHGLVQPLDSNVFLGLYRGWGWSLSDSDDYKEGEVAYWNWASGEPLKHNCGSLGPTGEWYATTCSLSLNFFCYDGFATDISKRFTLAKFSTNWWVAKDYCRKNHTDLARVRNHLENEELRRLVTGHVWIGLTRITWMWSDGIEPSFVPWKLSEPLLNGLADCSALEVNSDPLGLIDKPCDQKLPFLCYTVPVRKQLVRVKLVAGDASVNLKDPAVMDSILKWMEGRLRDKAASKDVNVSWMTFPTKENNAQQKQTPAKDCPPQLIHVK